ncbi:MAG: hypothetical protein GWO24_25595, partial [Akkermansiaceae bacterium]|nr:hypothetical protein [Akkermansiaceae bacterium]
MELAVPPGAYGTFRVHPGSGIVLGVAGASQPAVYSFESLVLGARTRLKLAGP